MSVVNSRGSRGILRVLLRGISLAGFRRRSIDLRRYDPPLYRCPDIVSTRRGRASACRMACPMPCSTGELKYTSLLKGRAAERGGEYIYWDASRGT